MSSESISARDRSEAKKLIESNFEDSNLMDAYEILELKTSSIRSKCAAEITKVKAAMSALEKAKKQLNRKANIEVGIDHNGEMEISRSARDLIGKGILAKNRSITADNRKLRNANIAKLHTIKTRNQLRDLYSELGLV